MKKGGYISVLVLFIMIIVFVSAMYINYLLQLQRLIEVSNQESIQSYYFAEAALNRVMYDEVNYEKHIKPAIINHLMFQTGHYKNFNITLDSTIDENDTNKLIAGRFYMDNYRKCMELTTESNYKGIKTNIEVSGPIIRDIFELSNLPLISYDLDLNTCEELEKYYQELVDDISFDNLPSEIDGLNIFNYNKIILKNHNSTLLKVVKVRNGLENIEVIKKQVFLNIRNDVHNSITTLEINDPLTLNGIIFLEGDLIINANFNFNGILILKGTDSKIIVNDEVDKPKIRGIIITEGETEFINKVDLKYDSGYIYKYGINLPGFIHPQLGVTKLNKGG